MVIPPSTPSPAHKLVQRHAFRQPAKPIEPPTPRGSLLGLDRLAKEKREQADGENGIWKKRRLDDGAVFKGVHHSMVLQYGNSFALLVPSLPPPRSGTTRQRGQETPSNPGGLSEIARRRLEEYRKDRERQKGTLTTSLDVSSNPSYSLEGISATQGRKIDEPKGLGDFKRRLNRDDRGWGSRSGGEWDSTPRSQRGSRDREGNAPSVRVPNVGWDSTPGRSRDGEGSGWGGTKYRTWDAATPRVPRGGSPEDDGLFGVDTREWEEEQIRLDRDWYSGAEEGGVAGDEEHNPLAQYGDLSVLKEVEIATKARVSPFFFRGR